MPKKRMPMNKIKEILRLRYECNLSNRQIAACLNIAHSTVSQHLSRFKSSGLTWLAVEGEFELFKQRLALLFPLIFLRYQSGYHRL